MKEIFLKDSIEFYKAHLDLTVNAAKKIYYSNNNQPVNILNLATGKDTYNFNPSLIIRLINQGIDYKIVLTDKIPTQLEKGYRKLKRALPKEESKKVKCKLVDLTNSKFEDNSFDLITGTIPYGSIWNYDAVNESVRVLKDGGYQIVKEWQVELINKDAKRTPQALKGAKVKNVDNLRLKLDSILSPVIVVSNKHLYHVNYTNEDECVQNGDRMKSFILVHRK